MKCFSDLFIEDDDEPVEASEKKENDDKSICHYLVTSLYCSVVILQFLSSNMNVVLASIF